jgi:tetratricopeptide (TPR) repeat protein
MRLTTRCRPSIDPPFAPASALAARVAVALSLLHPAAFAAEPPQPSAPAAAATSNAAPAAAPSTATPASAPPAAGRAADVRQLAERDAAYLAFRTEFDAGRYDAALPLAERVVELTEQYAPDPVQLPSALNNLGATHLKLGDYIAAERAYARALQIVEEQQGSTSRRLLTPLRGLALTYQAGGRKDAAAPLLERAIAISRRSDGLFNPEQLDLIEPLIDSYVSVGRLLDADEMHQYAFRLNERRYGPGSPRLVPSLTRLATWYEQTQRYTQARRTWARQYSNATGRGQENVAGAANALRGMARTYRLEYQYGPEPVDEASSSTPGTMGMGFEFDAAERDPFGRRVVPGIGVNDYRLDPQGREFLEAALEMVRKTEPPSPQAEAILLIELGDWTLLERTGSKALPNYERAWALLPQQDPGVAEAPKNPLLYPTPLLYRPPGVARRLRDRPADTVVERVAIAEFTVDEAGKVRDARIVEGDASEAQRDAFLVAIQRAQYRPRFVDGRPMATGNVRFRETFRELKQPTGS